MQQKPEKFRLRLNLFDSIVIVLALAAAAFLLWNTLKPKSVTPEQVETSTVRYTICLQRWVKGAGEAVHEGARLTDSIRNYEVGRVVSSWTVPATEQVLDHEHRIYAQVEIEGYEDVMILVEAPCVITDEAITVGGGYDVRVGARAYIQGDGFLGSGYVYAIEREG